MAREITLIPNYIYFYHLEKFCVLPMYPESIQDNMDTTFNYTKSLARSAPVFTFANSGPRTITVSLQFHRDMMNDINVNVSNLKSNVVDFSQDDYVDTLINYLQSMALPRYRNYSSGQKSVIPPMIAIRFGNDIFIKGVVSSGVQCNYTKPILYNNKYAQVGVQFTVSETDPYDADKVVQQGSFRGVTETFKNGIYTSTSSSSGEYTSGTSSSDNQSQTINNYVIGNLSNIHGGGGGTFGNSKIYKQKDINILQVDKIVGR